MAKFTIVSVAAVLVCFAIVNVAAELTDNEGKPCPICPTELSYIPVCGSNGKTYVNPSIMRCHSACLKSEIKIDHIGHCYSGKGKSRIAHSCPPCAATADLRPVCGNNGKTYPNKSMLDCDNLCHKSNVQVKHQGECA